MAQILVENLDPIILEKLETLAKQHPPTYDSLYLVLAITQQCQMVTAKDAKTPLRLCMRYTLPTPSLTMPASSAEAEAGT